MARTRFQHTAILMKDRFLNLETSRTTNQLHSWKIITTTQNGSMQNYLP